MIRYGLQFDDNESDLGVELIMIRYGGKIEGLGLGLFDHMMNARKLLWPERYRHEWTELLYREFIQNDITILMGAASTQKTSTSVEYALIRYFSDPNHTLVLESTITVKKLETGVFGETKMLWRDARDVWGDLIPGNLIDHMHAIATDNVQEGDVRDLRRGVLGLACTEGRKWVGVGPALGTKQDHIIYLGDELPQMAPGYLESWDNLFSNDDFKVIASGNPHHDAEDQLGIAAEPVEGWTSLGDVTKTTCWNTRRMKARCVNLVGTDSPNFHAAAKGLPEPFRRLIGPKFAARIAHDHGINSPKYYEQVLGVMKLGLALDRVLTRQLCRDHHAFEPAKWNASPRTKVHGLDPSYGGQDACFSVVLEFGASEEGLPQIDVLLLKEHRFDLSKRQEVEAQIAEQVWTLLRDYQIPPSNSFYDPYGKGTMGFAFATKFGHDCPIPVDSGGKPTERPVRQGEYITDKDGRRRLKKCSEHYSKFVTEAWFSVRYVIEANQMRDFPEAVLKQMCARTYEPSCGDKIELESKDDYKDRVGASPNEADALAIALEGARQRGFRIGNLGPEGDDFERDPLRWLTDMVRKHEEMMASKRLKRLSYAND